MKENDNSIAGQFPADSFQRLFWDQQIQAAKAKKTGIRWHPMMIRWCLNLKLLSSAAYSMRTAGVINLPSERTLRDYSHYIESAEGFQTEVEDQLRKEAKYDNLEESRKYIVLALDEMKIKEGLVYDKYGCRIVGFINLGETMNQIMDFERDCCEGKSELPVAKQMLVLMVRGLFFNLNFPYVQFTTKGITAEYLFPLAVQAQNECPVLTVLNTIGREETLLAKSERNETVKSQIKLIMDVIKSPLGATKIEAFDAALSRELESLVTKAVDTRYCY